MSHPSFHAKNFNRIIKILLHNGYPLKIIFSVINKCLHKKFDMWKRQSTSCKLKENSEIIYFMVPNVTGISEKMKNFFARNKVHIIDL